MPEDATSIASKSSGVSDSSAASSISKISIQSQNSTISPKSNKAPSTKNQIIPQNALVRVPSVMSDISDISKNSQHSLISEKSETSVASAISDTSSVIVDKQLLNADQLIKNADTSKMENNILSSTNTRNIKNDNKWSLINTDKRSTMTRKSSGIIVSIPKPKDEGLMGNKEKVCFK